jgi:hypothetical protein
MGDQNGNKFKSRGEKTMRTEMEDANGTTELTDADLACATGGDAASPTFFKNCCAGAHYQSVTVHM